MKTLLQLLLISFLLLMTLYVMIPIFIYFKISGVLFSQWLSFEILNLFVQPFLIGYSIYYLFKEQISNMYWFALFLTINTFLYLLPILVICSFLFSDWDLQLH